MKNNAYRFTSDLFEIKNGEDKATNPMRFGEALANWLSRKLKAHYQIRDCGPEDWGWHIEVSDDHYHYRLGCGNEDLEDFYPPNTVPLGSEVTWLIFYIGASPKSIGIKLQQLLGKVDKKAFEAKFVKRLEVILSDEVSIKMVND